ncbi:TIGR03663 family protein [Halalkaliarchaeum sp. AArc-GB]|uniref:flippase activity-associated protein Agl23 n=1 Tax=Halalkaliarchaeum sp. AArc-GB TaxID=3074078 RepID=UPI002857319E|nr:flippase activity-associated protein Agl23 [Halalkaliarchaeum sp. AArc-GB]MDR5672073.1 TIGR03663 family protein [Halalkaliarchaeum sp. AArc-GB]
MRPERLRDVDRRLLSLSLVVVAALFVRFVGLGTRVFHWDEGRVGYWTLRYADSGIFEYNPIIHGPFLPLVNSTVFDLLAPTDAVARLVVALVGGLLPLAAWLFRDHLDDLEVVALGLLLAFNPVLVYYGRFMRNDVLVAAFSVFALGFAIRAISTRDVRRLYPAVALVALAFTTKGNALLYLLCYAGATALVVDHLLVRARKEDRSIRDTVRGWLADIWRTLRHSAGGEDGSTQPQLATHRRTVAWTAGHAVGLAITFLAIVVWFFAPRPALWAALSDPSLLPGVFQEATAGSARELVDLWMTGDMQEHDYLEYAFGLASTMANAAAVVSVFAVVGMAVDTLGGRNRLFVAFCFYWGIASFVGYPAATDIEAGWTATHVVVPLTVPAAVGLAFVAREFLAGIDVAALRDRLRGGSGRIVSEDTVAVSLAGILLLGALAGVLVPTATYWNSTNPDHTELVQYAQPQNDLRESLDDVEAIVATHEDGPDVLFVGADHSTRGSTFYVANESDNDQKPAGSGWYDRLPLPWYLERAGAEVESSAPDTDPAEVADGAPPVVIAVAEDREALSPHFDGYVVREHEARLWGFRIAIFLDEDALASAARPVPS